MRLRLFGTVMDMKLPKGPVTLAIFVALFFMVTTLYFLYSIKDEDSRKMVEKSHIGRGLKQPHEMVGLEGIVPAEEEEVARNKLELEEKEKRERKRAEEGKRKAERKAPIGNMPGGKHADPKLEFVRTKQDMVMDHLNAHDKAKLVKTWEEILKDQKRKTDKEYNINVTLSDTISFDRPLPDSRPPVCVNKTYDYSKLPTASVIIPFNNEALSMLIRAVHSILNRSPDSLLKELILVDDDSSNENLKEPLDRYVSQLPKVRLLRTRKRVGLIKARMLGAEQAEGKVLVFQDAHTENNVGWLEPLLEEIVRHPKSVLQPSVDGVDKDTIEYVYGHSIHVGAFAWSLTYKWLHLPAHEEANIWEYGRSFWTPTLVGCIIAVDKSYFFDIGGFDDGLQIWGGENIELAFRVWQCGGLVMTVPCSRVGHVFKQFYGRFGEKEYILQKNSMRVAEVWMDGMKKFFYASTRIYEFNRVSFTKEEKRSVQERKKIRKRLKCKNFEWYLHNIVPRIEIPPMEAIYYGEVSNMETHGCFEMKDDYYVGITYNCFVHRMMPQNYFHITKEGLLKFKDKCVRIVYPTLLLYVTECPENNIEHFSVWKVHPRGHTWGKLTVSYRHSNGKVDEWCVLQVTNILKPHYREQMPQARECEKDERFSIWEFSHRFDFKI